MAAPSLSALAPGRAEEAAAVYTADVSPQESFYGPSRVTEEHLQQLVALGMMGPKEILHWRAPTGEDRPYEQTGETVVFTSFIERGLGLPTGDFFRGLLNFYGIELTHLNPNSILDISVFIYFCEGYLGIPPHFNLWRYL
ncbi:unnamed protein product [Urochloa humidicola]